METVLTGPKWHEAQMAQSPGGKESLPTSTTNGPNRTQVAQSPSDINPKCHEAQAARIACQLPTGCSEKPSLHCSCVCLSTRCSHLRRAPPQSPQTPAAFLPESSNSRFFFFNPLHRITGVPTTSDAAVDTSSAITTKDLKEKKEVMEEAENGRDAPANGNANEENGEQEAGNEVDEEEEEGGEEEEEEEEGDGEEEDGDEDEEAEAATGKRAAEDDEDDNVDTKKQKTDEDD
ncbi:acidic leucine-rich nuclear phosphoprotein 32 family member E-like [Phyllostomus discolor]|uniref:Prothymosin alpha n=1 Tax=Phyllostomus discolor TaxID=89673 RepID=A0A6J2MIS6_9CHIR|nr:acidic leucine-rich nuclear phosphoprotein 32 family member E-like [Phyllostomus discolor]